MEDFLNWLTMNWWVLFLFMICFGGGIWAGAKHLVHQWQEGRRREQETVLKRDMVAKGFAPEDIERVLQASAPPIADDADSPLSTASKRGASRDEPGFEKARLVSALAEHGMDAEGIERIMHVLGEYPDDELAAKVAAVQSLAEQGMDAEGIERVIRAFQRPSAPRTSSRTAEETSFHG